MICIISVLKWGFKMSMAENEIKQEIRTETIDEFEKAMLKKVTRMY